MRLKREVKFNWVGHSTHIFKNVDKKILKDMDIDNPIRYFEYFIDDGSIYISKSYIKNKNGKKKYLDNYDINLYLLSSIYDRDSWAKYETMKFINKNTDIDEDQGLFYTVDYCINTFDKNNKRLDYGVLKILDRKKYSEDANVYSSGLHSNYVFNNYSVEFRVDKSGSIFDGDLDNYIENGYVKFDLKFFICLCSVLNKIYFYGNCIPKNNGTMLEQKHWDERDLFGRPIIKSETFKKLVHSKIKIPFILNNKYRYKDISFDKNRNEDFILTSENINEHERIYFTINTHYNFQSIPLKFYFYTSYDYMRAKMYDETFDGYHILQDSNPYIDDEYEVDIYSDEYSEVKESLNVNQDIINNYIKSDMINKALETNVSRVYKMLTKTFIPVSESYYRDIYEEVKKREMMNSQYITKSRLSIFDKSGMKEFNSTMYDILSRAKTFVSVYEMFYKNKTNEVYDNEMCIVPVCGTSLEDNKAPKLRQRLRLISTDPIREDYKVSQIYDLGLALGCIRHNNKFPVLPKRQFVKLSKDFDLRFLGIFNNTGQTDAGFIRSHSCKVFKIRYFVEK